VENVGNAWKKSGVMTYYITGTRRGLGKALAWKYGNINSLNHCDVFINCKHDGFSQVEMLYKAAALGKRVISIGSHASDFTYLHKYAVEKRALREANNHLYIEGHNVTCVNFGYIDTERSAHRTDVDKMSIDQAIDVIDWIVNNPLRIKEITACI
tara:strand:+ start:50 stop:514 length:465 start_codon:yes stop_codon:yes gene_type:complete